MEGIGYENYTQGNYYQQSRTEPQYGAESWHLVTFLNPKLEKLTTFLHTLSHSFVWQFCLVSFLRQDLKALTRLALNS